MILSSFLPSFTITSSFRYGHNSNQPNWYLYLSFDLQNLRKCSTHKYYNFREFQLHPTSFMVRRPKFASIFQRKSRCPWRKSKRPWRKSKIGSFFRPHPRLYRAISPSSDGVRQQTMIFFILESAYV